MPLISRGTRICAFKTFNVSYSPFSLDELIKDGRNGLIFHNASQLAEQFEVCLLTLRL